MKNIAILLCLVACCLFAGCGGSGSSGGGGNGNTTRTVTISLQAKNGSTVTYDPVPMSLDVSGEGYEDIASALEVMIFQGLNTGDGIVNGIPHEGSGIMSGQSLEVPPNGNGSSWDFGAFFISGGQINYGGQANPDETLTNVLRKLRNKVGGPLDNVTLVITRVSR